MEKLGLSCPGVEIRVDGCVAKVWFETLEVECPVEPLKNRVMRVVERAVEAVAPLVDTLGV